MSRIDATVGGSEANSYVTLAEADAYLGLDRLHAESWIAAANITREASLIWATKILDEAFNWTGFKSTTEQALRWPRSGTYDADGHSYDYESIPKQVKDATCDLALALFLRDRTGDPAVHGLGLSSASLPGPLSVTVDKSMVLDLIPRHVALNLENLGELSSKVSGSPRIVKLERS